MLELAEVGYSDVYAHNSVFCTVKFGTAQLGIVRISVVQKSTAGCTTVQHASVRFQCNRWGLSAQN